MADVRGAADWISQQADSLVGQALQGSSTQELLNSLGGFKDRELQQRWDIAQLSERGASQRSSQAAAASTRNAQISASASTKNAKLAADTQRYGIDTDAQTARERLGLDTELGRGDLGVKRGQLGLAALELPTKYRGADNYFQQSDLLRGMSQRQDIPMFIANLLDPVNTNQGFGAPGGAPTGFSIGGVLGQMAGGVQGATDGQNGSALGGIRQLGQRGLQSLGPQALERLSPSEQGAFQSGLEYSGDGGSAWNWNDLLDRYNKSRIGQGNAFQA